MPENSRWVLIRGLKGYYSYPIKIVIIYSFSRVLRRCVHPILHVLMPIPMTGKKGKGTSVVVHFVVAYGGSEGTVPFILKLETQWR